MRLAWPRLAAGVTGLLAGAPFVGEALRLEGLLPRSTDFAEYVGKFCFDFKNVSEDGSNGDPYVGLLEYMVTAEGPVVPSANSGKLYLMIFDDESSHWKHARRKWKDSTCEEKKEMSSFVGEIKIPDKHQGVFHDVVKIRQRLRPRFWYFTIVACDGLSLADMPIRYELHSTNRMFGWQSEISVDHVGLIKAYIAFFILFLVGSALLWCQSRSGAVTLTDHPYIQLLTLCYGCSLASVAMFLTHDYLLVHNGFGSLRIRFFGIAGAIAANCTMFLISILSSAGWAITNYTLPSRRCFLGMIAFVGALNLGTELYSEVVVDQSTQLYSYQGSAGVFALVVKVFMFCWIAFQAKASYEDELVERRRRFYKILGIVLTMWSLSVPVTVVLAFAIDPWWRYKVVVVVEMSARMLGLLVLTQLFCGPLSPLDQENTLELKGDESGRFRSLG